MRPPRRRERPDEEDSLDALESPGERVRVGEVAADDVDVDGQSRGVGMTRQRTDAGAGAEQLVDPLPTHGAGPTRDEDHGAIRFRSPNSCHR